MRNLKYCWRCNQKKSLECFSKNKSKHDGLCSECKECCKEVKRTNPEYLRWKKQYEKKYCEKNKKKIRDYKNKWELEREKSDPSFKLGKRLRNRIRCALKGNFKHSSLTEGLGCSLQDLKKHLELQFQPGMTWENYGVYGWHIDHIKPLSSFDLTDKKQFLEACHYTNLRPLWAKENLEKHNK